VILVDTGPLMALFDPRDALHARCRAGLKQLREPLVTTVPVLTETLHILDPASRGSQAVRDFVAAEGLGVSPLTGCDAVIGLTASRSSDSSETAGTRAVTAPRRDPGFQWNAADG
jgi:hypothetical protein